MRTRKTTNPAATRRAGDDDHRAIRSERAGHLERTPSERSLRDDIEGLIHNLKSLGEISGDTVGPAGTHLTLDRDSGQRLAGIGSGHFAHAQASSVTVTAACAPVKPGSLPLIERLPEISAQLIVVEHLFQAAREKGSGAIPMPGDEEWNSFWVGLERIVREVRRLAEDMYVQGRLENY